MARGREIWSPVVPDGQLVCAVVGTILNYPAHATEAWSCRSGRVRDVTQPPSTERRTTSLSDARHAVEGGAAATSRTLVTRHAERGTTDGQASHRGPERWLAASPRLD